MAKTNQRSERERLHYGICLNDECTKSKNKEIQAIPMRKDFVCAECGKELRECPPPKKTNKKPLTIGAIALLIIGAVVAAIFLFRESPEPMTITFSKQQCVLEQGTVDTIIATITPMDADFQIQWTSSNEDVAVVNGLGVVHALAEGEATITASIQPKKGDPIMASCRYQIVAPAKDTVNLDSLRIADSIAHAQFVADSIARAEYVADSIAKATKKSMKSSKPSASSGRLRLSYGNYSGSTKNGYAHGQGRLIYTTTRVINRNDPKGRTAQPGDYVIGEFFNGFVVYGKHYSAAGELLESLTFGVGSESSYDSK